MGNLETNCLIVLLTVTIHGAPQHVVSLSSSDFSKFQLLKHSDDTTGLSNKGAATGEPILSTTFSRIIYESSSVKRVRRKRSWNSSEKNHGESFPADGKYYKENIYEGSDKVSNDVELNRRHRFLLFAQEESRCLEEFGELEPAISFEFPQDLFQPFVCLAGSQNYSACKQCIEIIRRVLVGGSTVSCQSSCQNSSVLLDCAQRCAEVAKRASNLIEEVRNHAISNNAEQNLVGRCNRKECSLKFPTSEVNGRVDTTNGVDLHSNTLTTDVFCEGVTQPFTKTQTTTSPTLTKSFQSKKSNDTHFTYLKSYFSDGGNNGTIAERKVPMVFVIEQRECLVDGISSKLDVERNWTSWKVIGKSSYGFNKIQVAYQRQTYQWRVTAVGTHGPLAVSIVKSFDTLDGYMEPGPPRRVFVIENKPKESTVDVLLGWDPPQERACFYKIVLETRNAEEAARTVRIKGEPLGVHKVWFRELRFDSTYEVRITSRSADWDEDESTHASLSFSTPACLDAHQFRFDKCAPPSPRNLTYTVRAMGSSKVRDVLGSPTTPLKRQFNADLMWERPAHATGTNPIANYIVNIRAFSWNLGHRNKNYSKHTDSLSALIDPKGLVLPRQIHLPGNVTRVKVENLDENAEYTVLISAVSSKGSSPPATLTIKFHADIASLDTTVGFWLYPCGLLVTLFTIASGFHIVKAIRTRRKIKAARDSYFKSMDQQDAYVGDWSVVSLTENPTRTWKMLEENSFPKAKWHVGFQDLTIGDVIGQGAFGIVRKAKIKSDKYLELLKRHNRKTLDTHYQICSTELSNDETVMETVALKMLRVAATKADREDLMKELMTMQSLGMHPQIVTLLGVCNTPKSMFLVLEYCPGGDLLSFLRKFREKHLPLLNLECGSSTNETWLKSSEYESLSHESELTINKGCGAQDDNEQVLYADLHHNELSSSSRELSDELQGAAKQDTETDNTQSNGDESLEFEFISEKDVLSYARQIAIGMAYLERNHIIHRDLACRNILVMADHKRVKISDFGLSRDIYTWNVYEQKTGGKMPFKWMALESITSRVFTSKSDVWSYGIVLWELVTLGAEPYPVLENQELFKMLRAGYRMERPDNCSEELYALMRKCWRAAPVDRPNFTELMSYLETMMDTEPELYLMLQP